MKKSKRSESAKKSSKKKNKKKPTQSKYKGYINGRDKRVRVPEENFKECLEELNDDDLQRLKDYLGIRKPSPDNLDYVYACPNCHVRITQRSDMLRVPHIWDEGNDIDMNAVFRWTTNLIERNGNVHCYRCNHDFDFKYRHDDSMILTLPMLKPGLQHRFLKREFRLLCLIYTKRFTPLTGWTSKRKWYFESERPSNLWEDCSVLKSQREESFVSIVKTVERAMMQITKDKQAKIVKVLTTSDMNDEINPVKVERKEKEIKKYERRLKRLEQKNALREKEGKKKLQMKKIDIPIPLENHLSPYFGSDSSLYTERMQLLNKANEDLGFTICFRQDLDSLDVLQTDNEENTYDFAFRFKIQNDKRDTFSTETDYFAVRHGHEQVHLQLWALSGGNMLLAQSGHEMGDLLQPDDFADTEYLASAYLYNEGMRTEDKKEVTSNSQPGFSKLINDGHLLGQWGQNYEYTQEMEKKMEIALRGKYLHPQWMFLHDYPQSVISAEHRWKNSPVVTVSVEADSEPYSYFDKATELHSPMSISGEGYRLEKRKWTARLWK